MTPTDAELADVRTTLLKAENKAQREMLELVHERLVEWEEDDLNITGLNSCDNVRYLIPALRTFLLLKGETDDG